MDSRGNPASKERVMREANDIQSDIKRYEAKLAKSEEHLVITQQRIDKRRASIDRLKRSLERAQTKPAPAPAPPVAAKKAAPVKAAAPAAPAPKASSKPAAKPTTKVSFKKK